MAEFTDQNVKVLIQGGSTVFEIANIFDKSFTEAYEAVQRVTSKRQLKAGDKYWYLYQTGHSVDQIAETCHSSKYSVIKAMDEMGHRIFDEPVSEDTNRLDLYRISVAQQLAEKWHEVGSHPKFLSALNELETKVTEGMPLFRSQPPSEGGEILNLEIPPSIIHRIDELGKLSVSVARKSPADPVLSRPKIIRRILEVATDLFPSPIDRIAKNRIGEPQWRTTFYVPIYAANMMRGVMGNKGSPIGLTKVFRDGVSRVLENPDVINEFPKPVVFNTPPHFNRHFAPQPDKKLIFATPIPTSLLSSTAAPLKRLIQTHHKRSRGMHRDFMVGMFLWHQKIDQTQLDGWEDWQELCSKCYWEDDDLSLRTLINRLIEKNFISLQDA